MSNAVALSRTSPLLQLKGVTLRRSGRLLLQNFELLVNSGERVVLTGPNGSGKSSLLRLAAGLLQAEAGVVQRGSVALANEDVALDRDLRLIAALEFWLGPGANQRSLADALSALDLAALVAVPVAYLSAGQAKRAAIVRVAASTAKLWLLDEPTNGLDEQGFEDLARLIDGHVGAGGAVLAASHLALPGEWTEIGLGQ